MYLITSRDAIISISLTVPYGRDYSETADRLMRYIFTLAVVIFHYLTMACAVSAYLFVLRNNVYYFHKKKTCKYIIFVEQNE